MAISPQVPEKNAEVKSNNKLAFPVLSDRGHAYARQLSIVYALPEELQKVYLEFGIALPDYNGDGSVDAADYTLWANGFGLPGADFTTGDYNGNGMTDAGDYTIWANNFGQMVAAPSGPAAAVPEPSTMTLLLIAAIGLIAARRRF